MKQFFSLLITLSLSVHLLAQRQCGAEMVKAAMIAHYPGAAQQIEDHRNSRQAVADNYKRQATAKGAARTTLSSAVPVIFHILVNSSQYAAMGGAAGIISRVDSQIEVLNRDYNKGNSDSTLIPSGWKHLYASSGIHFGLAHTDPIGHGSPGYEIKIITGDGFVQGISGNYDSAKHVSSGGLDAWDPTKYINVWCLNFSDYPGLLGITVAKSFISIGAPLDNMGICLNYLALGKQTSPASLTFPSGGNYTLGRSLTHEMGHFFEIWHTWGDDGGLCPWTGGSDDGLADTPPEANYKYGNPTYSIPGGTIYDDCRYDGAVDTQGTLLGVACLDFLNYTDDNAMHMFTNDQAAVMASQISPSGENYSLTQHPGLLTYPANAGIAAAAEKSFSVFPNPARDMLYVAFDTAQDELRDIALFNLLGQEVMHMPILGDRKNEYSIDLSGISRGIYLVRCNFASGSITRKITIQ
jgi:hypothetical protein